MLFLKHFNSSLACCVIASALLGPVLQGARVSPPPPAAAPAGARPGGDAAPPSAPAAGDPRAAAEQSFAEAERLAGEGEAGAFRAAIDKYREAAASWRAAGARGDESRALTRVGDVHLSFSEYQAAEAAFEQARLAGREARDRRAEGEALNGLASVHLTLGQNRRALELCARALALSRATGHRPTEARAINNIGEIQYGLGNLRRSVEFFEQALPLWRELGDRRGQALALLNLGFTHSDLGGGIQQAFDSYNEALALWQAAGDRRGEAVTLTAIGRLYSRVGEGQTALGFFEKALPLIRRAGDPVEEARAYTGMAFVYRWAGDTERAIGYYERALALFRAARYPNGEASALSSAGRAYFFAGDDRKALEYHDRALSIFRAIGDRRMEIVELKEIGRLYDARGDKAGALKNYLLALSFERTERNLRGESDTLNLLGRAYEGQGRAGLARECYERALALSRQTQYRFGEVATLYNLARAERGRGDHAAALAHTGAALGVVESLRTKIASQDLRASYFASARQLYELHIDLLMESHRRRPADGYDVAAFEASEQARARSLIETLAAARVGVRERVDPQLLARERDLREELSGKAERRLRLRGDEAAALSAEIEELTTRYREVSAQVRAAGLEHTERSQPRPLGLGEIRERGLDADTLLLEFFLGEERSYLWVAGRDSLHSYELPARARIEEAAVRVRQLLTAPAPAPGEAFAARQARLRGAEAEYWREAGALSEMLLAPAMSGLAGKRLLVVADGALQYVPFNALPVPGRGGEPTPLIVEHEITSQPSASVLAALRGGAAGRPAPAKGVAVFADPVFEADDGRLARAESAAAAPRALAPAARDPGASWEGGSAPRLVASRDEAEAIMSVAGGAENWQALGFDADKAAATGPALGQYRIIHFATHGVLDSEHPELSGLLLSRFDAAGRPREGFLRLDDIYNLSLPAEMVVLSACNTGLGKDVRGEGLVGLVRGFMHAGASRVVASLWKVDDDATAELMTHFYREMLQSQRSPAAALREAQVSMWRQRRWRAPYYWAAFVMQGDYGGRIEFGRGRGGSGWRWGAAGAAVVLAGSLGGLWALRRRARRRGYGD